MPSDPFGDDVFAATDEPSAVGMAVMDLFADGAKVVVVLHKKSGKYAMYGAGGTVDPGRRSASSGDGTGW